MSFALRGTHILEGNFLGVCHDYSSLLFIDGKYTPSVFSEVGNLVMCPTVHTGGFFILSE